MPAVPATMLTVFLFQITNRKTEDRNIKTKKINDEKMATRDWKYVADT